MTLTTHSLLAQVDQPPPPPALEALRSLDSRTADLAWQQAWPWLYGPAIALARARLRGPAWEQDREDIVATAIAQVQKAVVTAELARALLADTSWQTACDRLDSDGIRRQLPAFLGTHLTALLMAERIWPQWSEQLDTVKLTGWLCSKIDRELRCNQMRSFDDLIGMTQLIVRRRIYDAYRHHDDNLEDPVEQMPEPPAGAAGGDGQPPRFTMQEILLAVDAIAAPFPALFRDRFLEGLSTSEISDLRGVPLGTVTTCLWRGLKKLRRALTDLEVQTGAPPTPDDSQPIPTP
jgi:hypothetical protein